MSLEKRREGESRGCCEEEREEEVNFCTCLCKLYISSWERDGCQCKDSHVLLVQQSEKENVLMRNDQM